MTQPTEDPSTATFDVLPLSSETRSALTEMGYTHPTPVQRAVFEPAARGVDVVVQARTGTGKTTAFGLPLVDKLVRRSEQRVQALVLCPTRELALQVSSEVERLGKPRAVRVTAVYGGAGMGKQIDELQGGAQIVVGTPGRVLDHIRRGTFDTKTVRMLVLDEADEMLSMGFEKELSAILDALPKERQTLLFSATLPPDIERMAKNKLKSPEFLTLSSDGVGALSIEHLAYFVTGDKGAALVKIVEVENPESAIVFCNTKAETEAVAGALSRAGYDADWLNGDMSQADRETVMAKTREGKLRFLVATDVAARGIDISHLTHVINYDLPDSAESYVHRTGRTGRAGKTGTAISLIRPKDIGSLYMLRLTYNIRPIERHVPSAGELKTRREADLVAMLDEAYGAQAPHEDDLALARRLLTHERAEAILAGVLRAQLGARDDAAEKAAEARRATTPAPRPIGGEEPRSPVEPRPSKAPRGERHDRREPRHDRREPRHDERARPDTSRGAAATGGAVRPPVVAPSGGSPDAAPLPRAARPHDARHDREHEGGAPRRAGRDAARDADDVGIRFTVSDAPISPAASTPPSGAPRPGDVGRRPVRDAARAADDLGIRFTVSDAPAPPAAAAASTPARAAHEPSTEGEGAARAHDWIEIVLDLGRRDDIKPADVQQLLRDKGIGRSKTRYIRVRDDATLVSVRIDVRDAALAALSGATLGGKQASAHVRA